MISKELIKKIRHIEIKSSKLVEEVFSGEYKSRFKGKGMSFEDIREYYPGDDIRHIDWNVTARHNRAYVKQFSEERELNMFLLIDVSHSNRFAGKKEMIAEIGATLSYSANKNNDKVGMMLFTDRVERIIPSKSGKRHVLSIIETILAYTPENKGTDLNHALVQFQKMVKKPSILFVISDFMDEGYEKTVKTVMKKHDVVLIKVRDAKEDRMPYGGIFTFRDLETDELVTLDLTKEKKRLNDSFNPNLNNVISVYTNEDYVKLLRLYFRKRGGL